MERNLLLVVSVTGDLAYRGTEIDMKKLILIKEISNVQLVGESLQEKQLYRNMRIRYTRFPRTILKKRVNQVKSNK